MPLGTLILNQKNCRSQVTNGESQVHTFRFTIGHRLHKQSVYLGWQNLKLYRFRSCCNNLRHSCIYQCLRLFFIIAFTAKCCRIIRCTRRNWQYLHCNKTPFHCPVQKMTMVCLSSLTEQKKSMPSWLTQQFSRTDALQSQNLSNFQGRLLKSQIGASKGLWVINPTDSMHIFLANGTSCNVSILVPAIQAIMVSWSAHKLQTENIYRNKTVLVLQQWSRLFLITVHNMHCWAMGNCSWTTTHVLAA
jgi:hypothetical protein